MTHYLDDHRTLIHLDPDRGFQETLADQLIRQRYRVYSTPDCDTAWELLTQRAARVLIMDPHPFADAGFELINRIKAFDPDLQVIVVTSQMTSDIIVKVSRLGADECLFKPLDEPELLLKSIRRAVNAHPSWWKNVRNWLAARGTSTVSQLVITHPFEGSTWPTPQ